METQVIQTCLPLELWEMIIEQCAFLFPSAANGHDTRDVFATMILRRRTLRACALTCAGWLPVSLRCLYRSVLLFQNEVPGHPCMTPEEGIGGRINWIYNEYGIRAYAEVLPLRVHILFNDTLEVPHPSEPSVSLPGASRGFSLLAFLFPELDQLRTVQLPEGSSISPIVLKPSSWKARLCANAIQELCLYSIYFESLSLLTRIIGAFPSLRRLFMVDIGLWSEFPIPPPSDDVMIPSNDLKLSVFHCRLHLDLVHNLLQWMVAHQVLAGKIVDLQIQSLKTWVNADVSDPHEMEITRCIQSVLFSAGDSLKHLDIQCDFEDSAAMSSLDLRANRSLETLVVGCLSVPAAAATVDMMSSPNLATVTLGHILPRNADSIDILIDAIIESPISLSPTTLGLSVGVPMIHTDRVFRNLDEQEIKEVLVSRCERLNTAMGDRFKLAFRQIVPS